MLVFDVFSSDCAVQCSAVRYSNPNYSGRFDSDRRVRLDGPSIPGVQQGLIRQRPRRMGRWMMGFFLDGGIWGEQGIKGRRSHGQGFRGRRNEIKGQQAKRDGLE